MKIRRLTWLVLAAGALMVHAALSGTLAGSRKLPVFWTWHAAAADKVPFTLTFPLEKNSVRFAAIGDSGTGETPQYEVARAMADCRKAFPYEFVIMLGDNVRGDSPHDLEAQFGLPYKSLLDAGVNFYASLGNHDNTNERFYKPFNMSGQRYYTFKKGEARFFALDSNYMDRQQLDWLETQLRGSSERWKICFFHHPLYSAGRAHGPDLDLRAQLEPLLDRYHVNIVFSGHDHVYERMKPQRGVYYFVLGNSGHLRYHNLHPSAEMAAGFDTDRAFMIAEISGQNFYFETISREAEVVDSGTLAWQKAASH